MQHPVDMPEKSLETIDTDAFVLSAETRMRSGSTSILMYCASPIGTLRLEAPFAPFFFVPADRETPPSVRATRDDQRYRSLGGIEVRKLTFLSTADAESARTQLRGLGVPTFESDLRPRERFFMQSRINGGIHVTGAAVAKGRVIEAINPEIAPVRWQPHLRLCSLDIETSVTNGTVLSIAAHFSGRGAEKTCVSMRGDGPAGDGEQISFVADERSLLTEFLRWFSEEDPDIIIGWNVIGFDLVFLRDRAAALGIPLRLGRDNRDFSISENTGRFARAFVPGRIVLDGPQLLRTSFFSFESYSLESVSREVLGEGKLIGPGENKAAEIELLFKTNPRQLAEYNIKDTILVTRIFDKLQLLELTIRRTELSGMLLDQVGMSTASLDHFLIPRLHDAGYVAPDVDDVPTPRASSGGYVMSPQAGIYEGVIALDFQSLYPSIIRTFCIDPLSYAARNIDPLNTPSGHSFSRTSNVLPDFIGWLMSERRRAKTDKNAPLSQAIKILMNSFYGVMGSPGSRMYNPALPDAITGTGQWLLTESRAWLEQRDHHVIYGDTDSLFVKAASSEVSGSSLAANLNSYWTERLSREFGVESFLLLEFKKQYIKFLVPGARVGEGGAKKRYAGLVRDGNGTDLEFVGLEVVRSDWTRLARDFQVELYTKIFHEEPLQGWLRSYVDQVRSGRFDEKLVYRKKLHKPIKDYGSSPPPYVRAAMQLPRPSRDIRYVMTAGGPVPIELEPKNFDYAHYITKQLKPVADSVLGLLGTSFDTLVNREQLSLF